MLDFSDAPYQFFPAKPNRLLMALGKFVNRRFILPGPNHRVTQIDLCGEVETVRALAKSGKTTAVDRKSSIAQRSSADD